MAEEKKEIIRRRLQEEILQEIDYARQMSDDQMLSIIDDKLLPASLAAGLTLREKEEIRLLIFHSIRRFDVLQDLLEDPKVSEIMVNGPDHIFVEKSGELSRLPAQFTSPEKLEDVIQSICALCNRTVSTASPIVDARLSDGSRVNVVLSPVALNGPIVTIRRFPEKPIGMEDLVHFGSISEEIVAFLKDLVSAGYNIFISGGTGSGKTTFLNALSEFIPKTERVITIEDNAELQIRHIENLVTLEARNANVEGCEPITIRDLIRSSLRMRPDRIIVGEVRGAEALDMIQAMNTGHDGSMSTGHANSASDMLSRLETMVLFGTEALPVAAIRSQLSSGIDLIVHLGRLRDRSRKLLEITEIDGCVDGKVILRPLYRFVEDAEEEGRIRGHWEQTDTLKHRGKLLLAGLERKEASLEKDLDGTSKPCPGKDLSS